MIREGGCLRIGVVDAGAIAPAISGMLQMRADDATATRDIAR